MTASISMSKTTELIFFSDTSNSNPSVEQITRLASQLNMEPREADNGEGKA